MKWERDFWELALTNSSEKLQAIKYNLSLEFRDFPYNSILNEKQNHSCSLGFDHFFYVRSIAVGHELYAGQY